MCLNEFTLKETQQFLKTRSEREVMTAHLTLGGIPEYLKQISGSSSVLLGICENSFVPKGYFTTEHKRIFISSMANNPHYKLIIEFLSEARFATRNEIRDKLEISSGGSLTEVLNDLEMSGFIEKYVPYQAEEVSTLARYCIRDAYLMFYFKFIRPLEKNIRDGVFAQNPLSGLNMESYQKWMGYSFERFIRRNHFLIAKILGFSGVRYRSGVFYNRGTQTENAGYQIDLIFDRDDNVITVCEVRFYSDAVDTSVISELEAKLKLHPNPKNHTIQKILITTVGITQALQERNYFDKVITLTDLFHDRYWL
jgi:hypothetical protein